MMMFGNHSSTLDLKKVSINAQKRMESRTIERRTRINDVVWEYVRSHDRIVYGGAALDALLREREGSTGIYDDTCVADIEFYSPDPSADVMALCDILHHDMCMPYVHGREAVHPGTLTVSVEFVRCFDVTFMSQAIMSSLPFLRLKCGGKCAHPHVMAMDLLRMMTEPDTSYWRLEKAFSRFKLMESRFPLGWDYKKEKLVATIGQTQAYQGDWWHILPNCVGVGAVAAMHFGSILRGHGQKIDQDQQDRLRVLQLVSTDFDADLEIARPLVSLWTKASTEMHYDAFGDLLGRSVRFLDKDGSCLVEIIDAHPRCVPLVPQGPVQGRIASSLYCIVTAMACHLRAFTNRDQVMVCIQSDVCTHLMATRVVSCSIGQTSCCTSFDDFDLDNIHGVTISGMKLQQIAHTLKSVQPVTNKAKKSRVKVMNQPWFRYNPSEGNTSKTNGMKGMVHLSFPPRAGCVVGSRPLHHFEI